MRTTIILQDELGRQLQERARREGKSLSAFLADAGRAALRSEQAGEPVPFRLITYGQGGPRPGVNLDRVQALIAAEDEANYSREAL